MSGISFGIISRAKKVKEPLNAFAEPDDAALPEEKSPEKAAAESRQLQEEGNEKAAARQYSSAVHLWDRALVLTPSRAVLHELKSQVYLELGYDWQAIQSATTATELEPTWPEAFLSLARAQLSFGEPEAALRNMEQVILLQPNHPEAIQEIGHIRMLVLQRKQDPRSAGQRLQINPTHSST